MASDRDLIDRLRDELSKAIVIVEELGASMNDTAAYDGERVRWRALVAEAAAPMQGPPCPACGQTGPCEPLLKGRP